MKKATVKSGVLIAVFLALGVAGSHAQIRHVAGIKGVDVRYSMSKYGSMFGADYVQYFGRKFYMKAGLGYGTAEDDVNKVGITRYMFDLTAAYTVLNVNEVVFINVIGGGTAGLEQLTEKAEGGIDSEFKLGVFGGAEAEIFFNDRFVFIMNFNQRFLNGNYFGTQRYYITAGLRVNFIKSNF
jgi:hypothetical protein